MIGLRPPIAAPVPTPAKPYSVIGVSITRFGAELVEQALGDLVGALIFGDLLAHHEDAVVGAHLLGHGVAQRLADGRADHLGAFGHVRLVARLRRPRRPGRARRSRICCGRSAPRLRRRRSACAWSARLRRRRRRGGAGGAADASSPSPAMSAMTVPTFTSSVPSGTRILAIVPSSTASNSIVALSVSISARMSPEATLSPSLTSHLASVPSSMVGEERAS